MSQNTPETKRLFVGGLFNGATPEDLKERFGKYGMVKSVDLKTKKNDIGEVINTFAFIDFNATPAKLRQCIDVFNKAKWKGKELKIHLAKENFLDRLEKERQSVVKLWSPVKNENDSHVAVDETKVKGPPGTALAGKEGWVVGKYGQIVPVFKVKKDGKKTVVFDPSKNCHGIKRFNEDDDNCPKISINQLTWQLEEKNTPAVKSSKKKQKHVTKKKSSDSESESDAETESKTPDKSQSITQRIDSDNESRSSCDTDELFRRTKSARCSTNNKNLMQDDSTQKHSSLTSNFDTLAKKLAFSEFEDGLSGPEKVKAESNSESESDVDEDVFDLIENGKIEKLLKESNITQAATGNPLVSSTPTVQETSDVSKSKKRKKVESEFSKVKMARIESPGENLNADDTNKSLMSSEVSRKRKRSHQSGDDEKIVQSTEKSKRKTEVEVSQLSDTSPSGEILRKRKKNDLKLQERPSVNFCEENSSQSDENEIVKVKKNKVKKAEKAEGANAVNMKLDKQSGSWKDSDEDCSSEENGLDNSVRDSHSEQKNSLETTTQSLVKGSPSVRFMDFQAIRYNPSAADHEKFEITETKLQKDEKKKVKQVKREEEVVNKPPKADVKHSPEKSVPKSTEVAEVDSSVVDVFKNESNTPFSLGAIFGNEDESEEETETKQVTVQRNLKKKPKVVIEDNSDDDEEDETKSKVSRKCETGGFFYHKHDSRLKDSKFYRQKDLEEIRKEWSEKRPLLVEAYRNKKKKPLRPYGKAPRTQGKKTFKKNKA